MKRKSNEYDAASAVATNESLIAMSASPSLSPRDVMSVATSIQSTSLYLDASEDERTNSPSDMSPFFDASAYDARRFSLSSADSLSSESPAVPSLPVQSMLAALADDSQGVPSPPKRGRGRPKRSVAPSASSSSSAAVPPLVLPPTEGSSFQLPSPLPESSPIPSPKKGSIVEWNGCYFSMQALKVLQKMQDEARKRNSDEFGVFIYNEFSAYGCIEVIENEMLHVERWLLRKQKPCDAFRTLEGITHFMQRDSSYSRIDDNKRVKMLVSTFSAAWIHTLKALTQCGSLTAQVLPNLVEVVFRAAQVVELHVGVAGRFTRADEHLRSFLDLLQSGVQDQFSLVFSLEARDHDAEEDERDGVQYLEDFEENFDFGDSLEFYRLQYGDNTRIIGGERFDLSLKPQNFLAPYRNGRARDVSGDEFINSMML